MGFSWVLSGLWAPLAPKLQVAGTIICGFWMRSMKKSKMIVENSSFEKLYFPLDLQISKFMHKFGVKNHFCPFSRETRFLGFEFKWSKHKVIGSKITNPKRSKSIFFEIKDKFPLGHASHEPPLPGQTRLNGSQNSTKLFKMLI